VSGRTSTAETPFEPVWLDDVNGRQVLRQRQPWLSDRYAGGRNLSHDPKSREFRADVSQVRPRLRRVVHRHYGPVLDQLKLGSCTGNSGAQTLNSEPIHVPGEDVHDEDYAVELYSEATRVDPWAGSYPPDDTGSSGLAVGKVLVARGDIDRYEWGFGIDDTLRLATLDTISIGSEWTEGMFDPDRNGFIRPTGATVGGHQWTLRGIDWREEWGLILNSWGLDWGGWVEDGLLVYPGHAKIRFEDLEELVVARQGDVIRFVRTSQERRP
jgi:hypothetical protein